MDDQATLPPAETQAVPALPPATFFQRYAALHIDVGILSIVVLLTYYIVKAFYRPENIGQVRDMHELMINVCYVYFICYYATFALWRWHATPGRRLMKIYIRNESGELPSFERTMLRTHISAVAYLPVIYVYCITVLSILGIYNPFDSPDLQGFSPLLIYIGLWVIGSVMALFVHLLVYFAVYFLRRMHHNIPRHKSIQDLFCETDVVQGRF